MPLAIQVGDFKIHKPLLLWVNDGLMAIFFFLVGLELKREFLEGELSDIKRVVLPALGAIGGILLAFFIPMHDHDRPDYSPLKTLEHDLHQTVTHIILPIFAFCNAGVSLAGVGLEQFTHNVPLGIMIGLFFGKQIGVFALCWLGIKLKIAKMPHGANWLHLYGVSVLCGIGFTMSLFIGTLAFEETGINALFDERLGILAVPCFQCLGIYGLALRRKKR